MTGGVLAVLLVLAVPVALVVAVSIRDARHNHRIRADRSRSVAGIRERVGRERAEAAAADAPTEVLPALQPAPPEEPMVPLRPVLPRRLRPYVQGTEPRRRPPLPHPRARFVVPDRVLMRRVLEGLRQLPDEPPQSPQRWPGSDPDATSPPA